MKTVHWWHRLPSLAKAHWCGVVAESYLDDCRSMLSNFVKGSETIWAHGTDFDIGVLRTLFDNPPWVYNSVRDARTIYRTLKQIRVMPTDLKFVEHYPVDDASPPDLAAVGADRLSRGCVIMAESDLNRRVRGALKGFDPRRVENLVGPGTPDVNFTGGWIEDKWLASWPVRYKTIVKVPKYVKEQRSWHISRRAAGGTVFVVIEIGDERTGDVLVFDAANAARGLGFWTRNDMITNALLHMHPWNSHAFRKFVRDYCHKQIVDSLSD